MINVKTKSGQALGRKFPIRGSQYGSNPYVRSENNMLEHNLIAHRDFLLENQNLAASVWNEIDWENCQPKIIIANTRELRNIYNYYRIIASRYTQKMRDVGMCRSTRCLIIDENSKGIMGVVLYADVYDKWTIRDDFIGWSEKSRLANINKIIHIQRAVVIPPYGEYLVGKLLYSMAISWQMVKYLGLKYSHKICLFTTHGVGLNRNKLVERLPWWQYLGMHNKGARSCSVYACQTRKKSLQFMRGECSESKLRRKVPDMDEIIEYWKMRWLSKRKNINFNPQLYKIF